MADVHGFAIALAFAMLPALGNFAGGSGWSTIALVCGFALFAMLAAYLGPAMRLPVGDVSLRAKLAHGCNLAMDPGAHFIARLVARGRRGN